MWNTDVYWNEYDTEPLHHRDLLEINSIGIYWRNVCDVQSDKGIGVSLSVLQTILNDCDWVSIDLCIHPFSLIVIQCQSIKASRHSP